MDRFRLLAITSAASLAMCVSAFSEDQADAYLKAWQSSQMGETLEREAKPRQALEKFKVAQKGLTEILKSSPDWQPLVVEYRLKKVQESIARLEPEVAKLPPEPEGLEGPLPQADVERSSLNSLQVPSVQTTTPGAGTTSRPRPTPRSNSTRPDSGSSAAEAEMRRELAALRRDNERMKERLARSEAEYKASLVTLDRVKVNLVEKQSEIALLTQSLDDVRKDASVQGNAVPEMRASFDKEMAKAIKLLNETQADNQVLEEKNAELLSKLDAASKYITSSDEIRKGLLTDRTKLTTSRDEAVARTKKIKDNSVQLEKVTTENKTLLAKITTLEKSSVGKTEFDKLQAENKALSAKLADAVKKAADDKKEFEDKLAAAAKDSAAKPDPEKEKQIVALQSELNTANDKLLEAQAQLAREEEMKKVLQKQFDEATGQLAKLKINPAPTKEEKSLIAENDLLRGIILREIKEQNSREEARKKLESEVVTLKIQSDVINQQLAVLGAPLLQLSPEERALFKDPVALLNEPTAENLQVTMVVAKPKEGDVKDESLSAEFTELDSKAKKLFAENNLDEAEKAFQEMVEKVPDNYYALSNLGAVQVEAGKYSAAEVALKRAIELNDKNAFAHLMLGIVYSRQGRYDDALPVLGQAVSLDDKDWRAHNYLGVCLGQKGHRGEAEKEFKQAITLDENKSADAHFNLAVLYATSEPPALDLAKLHYNKATELGAAPDPSLERLIQ